MTQVYLCTRKAPVYLSHDEQNNANTQSSSSMNLGTPKWLIIVKPAAALSKMVTESHFFRYTDPCPQSVENRSTHLHRSRHSPVMEEDLLIVIGCFNKPKVIFQGCHIPHEPLGAVVATKHSDRNSCLQTSSLHFTDTELDLLEGGFSRARQTNASFSWVT